MCANLKPQRKSFYKWQWSHAMIKCVRYMTQKEFQNIWMKPSDNLTSFLCLEIISGLKGKRSKTGQMQLLFSKEQQNLSFGRFSKTHSTY